MKQVNERDEGRSFRGRRVSGTHPQVIPHDPKDGFESRLGRLEFSVPLLTLQVVTVSMNAL